MAITTVDLVSNVLISATKQSLLVTLKTQQPTVMVKDPFSNDHAKLVSKMKMRTVETQLILHCTPVQKTVAILVSISMNVLMRTMVVTRMQHAKIKLQQNKLLI